MRQQFTSKERDIETGLDFFEVRYYSSKLGRFTSPDSFNGGPSEVFTAAASENPTFYADLTNPQTLNKYEYANNNPLRYIDPTGHSSSLWDSLANWIWGQGDLKQREAQQAASPFGVDDQTLAAWIVESLGASGVAQAELYEAFGLDGGALQWAREMSKERTGQADTFGLLKSTAGISIGVLSFGVGGGEAKAVERGGLRVSEKGLSLG